MLVPGLGVAAATRQFLEGTGAPLLAFDELSRPLRKPGGDLRSTCEAVTTALAQRLGDTNAADLALQAPDAVLAQLFLGEQAAVTNGLVACRQGESAAARTEFALSAKSADLIRRRLDGLAS